MDFRDSPEEAAFRERLRAWLGLHAKEFPTSGDEYWERAGDWHRALYEGGFFGLSWPREYGGQELAPVYDVIRDEELTRAGAPARPSLGYLVTGLGRHGSKGLQQRFLPGMINGTERWCQGFSEPATTTSSTGTRSGPVTPTSRTGACCWRAPIQMPSGTGVFRHSSSRCTSQG